MEKIFVDTSGWYSFLNISDACHRRVKEFITSNRLPLTTSNFVVTELLNLLVTRRQKKVAVDFGQKLREQSEVEIFSVLSKDEDEAWRIFQKYKDKDFSFTDCTSFALMRRLGINKVVALDDDFSQMKFEVLPPS